MLEVPPDCCTTCCGGGVTLHRAWAALEAPVAVLLATGVVRRGCAGHQLSAFPARQRGMAV